MHMEKTAPPIGTKFGRWLVLGRAESRGTHPRWLCQCDCGQTGSVNINDLKNGRSKSCGCFRREHPNNVVHGLRRTPLYGSWSAIITRCYNANIPNFYRYGGRGIKMCEFLRASPANLLLIVGEKPAPDLSVGRIDNDGMYSCGTCAECLQKSWPLNIRWETRKQQTRNTRRNRFLTISGTTKSLAQWAEDSGITYRAFEYRVNHGLDPFTKPK